MIENDILATLTTKCLYKDANVAELSSVVLTPEQGKLIEESTRDQSMSQEWKEQRKGRITASYFGRVCKVKTGVDRLVLELLGESAAPEGLPALQWGRKKENAALISFEKVEGVNHADLKITRSGLYVSLDKPYLGASPDGFANCSCCPPAVLEIKCPYSIRNNRIGDSCGKSNFFLDENKKLKRNHNYYYQVQGLMHITDGGITFAKGSLSPAFGKQHPEEAHK
ncbi:hypothetical protein JTE90_026926 [Oedothorax gibbosus]|uniref:YqaJ viral recombinase domain-containing protein n=1 Tax=Oedothorax gibbosus TaxID=931172 RepID=A0AAV6TVG6_9ARAC|nr:hypothetical protein JTE90_026926 [Oedothorax gibbosus]